MKIDIKNYQRLENINIELTNGINLIRGSSNNGKSSVIRAVRDFIFNKTSKDKIRHGESELSISLDTAKLTRNSKGVTYEIDGELLEKVGRNTLPEIKDKFNIDEFEINGVSIRPNFWFQMDKPFLFDKTAGQKNDLLVGTKNDKYIKVLKKIKSEQIELTKVDKKVSEELVNNYKKKISEIKASINKKEGVEDLAIEIQEHRHDINYHTVIEKLLTEYNDSKCMVDKTEQLLNTKKKLQEEYQLDDLIAERETLRSKMKKAYDEYSALKTTREEYFKNKDKLKSMKSCIEIDNTEIENRIKFSKEQKKLLAEFNNIFSLHEKELNNKTVLEKSLTTYKEELANKEKELADLKKEVKICPICGGNL